MKTEYSKDTSCWYYNPFDVNKRVFNQAGEHVELNTPETNKEYEYFKSLNLIQDNYDRYRNRYIGPCPYMYECIVYGHNHRLGYLKSDTKSLTEAINLSRVRFAKLIPKDDPRKQIFKE